MLLKTIVNNSLENTTQQSFLIYKLSFDKGIHIKITALLFYRVLF